MSIALLTVGCSDSQTNMSNSEETEQVQVPSVPVLGGVEQVEDEYAGDPYVVPLSKIPQTKADWLKKLTPLQYSVTREKDTERAFSNKFWDNHKDGTYRCIGCGIPLFESDTKFDSGTGWPSFYASVSKEAVEEDKDTTFGMVRTEVLCKRCGAHLGHLFPWDDTPTKLRYCINSASLTFEDRAARAVKQHIDESKENPAGADATESDSDSNSSDN